MLKDTELDLVLEDLEKTHGISPSSHELLFCLNRPCTCSSSGHGSQDAKNPNCFSRLLHCPVDALLQAELTKAGCVDVKHVTGYTLESGPAGLETSDKPFAGLSNASPRHNGLCTIVQTLFACTSLRDTVYKCAISSTVDGDDDGSACMDACFIRELSKVFARMEFSLQASISLEEVTNVLFREQVCDLSFPLLFSAVVSLVESGCSRSAVHTPQLFSESLMICGKTKCLACEHCVLKESSFKDYIKLAVGDAQKASLNSLLSAFFGVTYLEDECPKCFDGVLERSVKLASTPPVITLTVPAINSEGLCYSLTIPCSLDANNFVSEKIPGVHAYELLSVACCIGRKERAVYVVYIKKYDKWWRFTEGSPAVQCNLCDLPFHLTDSEGNLVTPNDSGLIYNYAKRSFTECALLSQDSALVPCMLFYQKKGVVSEASACPKKLSEPIIGESFKLFQQAKRSEKKALEVQKRVRDHAAAYDKLAESFSQIAPGKNYYWISEDWLKRLMTSTYLSGGDDVWDDDDDDDDDESSGKSSNCCPIAIDLRPFACMHGHLDIMKLGLMKRISSAAWRAITEAFPIKNGSPVFDSSSECNLCARDLVEKYADFRHRKEMKGLFDKENAYLNRLDTPCEGHEFYYVSTEFYKYFEVQEVLPLKVDVDPTREITCKHGNLKFSPSKKNVMKVSKETWEWISSHCNSEFVSFKSGSTMCAACKNEIARAAQAKKELEKYLYYRYGNFGHDIEPGVLYFLVDREWYMAVRNYVCFKTAKPEPFNFKSLLCEHGKLMYNITTEFLPDGILAHLSEVEWSLLCAM